MKVIETDRLVLRWLTIDDAEFILKLVNDPAWLRFIGDKGVRTLEDARDYILKGPVDMYMQHGFGLYLTELKSGGTPIGICGLLKRETLDDVDIGFAFLPEFREKGYGFESADAVMAHGKQAFGLKRLVAITSAENEASIRLLEKLGLKFEKNMTLTGDNHEISLFGRTL
jgi:RimJ/RimL family protein N-acetyltransferase